MAPITKMALLWSVDVRVAPLRLCFYLLFNVFLLSLFTRIMSALIIYDKRTLLDIGHRFCRPFYLPREFSSIVVTAVYISPQADTSLALSKLHDELSGYINKHPDAASIIAGDFNKANLGQVMPNFHQHVSCPTRGSNKLDHCQRWKVTNYIYSPYCN